LDWVAIRGYAISHKFLQHDGSRNWIVFRLAARPGAVADVVAVDFVDDVAGTVGVLEAGWVDGSALLEGATAESVGEGNEWSACCCACGGADAVVGLI
jgi:hypothetical protein